jgi:hypothetical protein
MVSSEKGWVCPKLNDFIIADMISPGTPKTVLE